MTLAQSLIRELRALRPDRGNRYASKTVRAKGAAAYHQWENTVGAMAIWLLHRNALAPFSQHSFSVACHDEGGMPAVTQANCDNSTGA